MDIKWCYFLHPFLMVMFRKRVGDCFSTLLSWKQSYQDTFGRYILLGNT